MTDFTLPANRTPPKESVAGAHEGRAILIATILSLMLHGLMLWYLYDKTLGREVFDSEIVEEYRVQRADRDLIAEDFNVPFNPGEQATGPGASSGIGTASTLAKTSSTMLGNASLEPSGGQGAAVVGGNEWRRPAEIRPGPVGGNSNASAPPVALPDVVNTRLPAGPGMEIEFKGEGTGTGSRGGSIAASEAGEMLAGLTKGTGLGGGSGSGTGVGGAPASANLGRTAIADKPGSRGGGGPGAGTGGGATLRPPVVLPLTPLPPLPENKLPEAEHLDDDFEYAVTVFETKNAAPYARVDITPKRTLKKLHTLPRDVVILIDVSGSVPQEWVGPVTRGVTDALSSLNEGDRFNIVLFSDKPAFFNADSIQPYNAQTVTAAQEFLKSAQSGGYTDVNQALSRLMVRDVAVNRVYDLVLISDGVPTRGVMNTRELINLITRDNDLAASIYCVGVGPRQNRTLLEFLAYRNRGFCVYADSELQAANVIRDLMSRLRYPIMKDIKLAVAGLDNDEVFPRNVPNIHQGESFAIFGRFHDYRQFTMRLSGHNGDKPLDFTFTRDLKEAAHGSKQIAEEWAFWKLHHLYSELIRQGEPQEKQIKAQIETLRKEYGLKTLY
ncbi:MAG: VWA domain-containing protein [Phycisphaeraceae bacterium]|nr:VWA domain-containing protein [Phycisphaeraceae bacterium]